LNIDLDFRDADTVSGSKGPMASCPVHRQDPAQLAGQEKSIVLTGGSRGIGHATAKLFSDAGWRIITCSRHPFDGGRCPWDQGSNNHVEVELSDHNALPRAIAEIKARLAGQPLHALINNAAISPKGDDGERLDSLSTSVETWMKVFHVNFLAPILLA
jgi:NAD(P)-dependent dehydrogenase (short-subunit alcohol dehydrogenase family)